ncbi:heavy-metal-associated domain-containing protein [Nocardia araoensis]|uniref:heavy-metal-associated domain-containing protein n=1 Tax=Nocardia araoensis TaxID=228600 RepID=UPI0002D2D372|nr:heavy-metal-associated domain-containing protein [Nocardia araoensis]
MNTTTLNVTGMTCGCCAGKVRDKVGKIAGVRTVEVDVAEGLVTITATEPIRRDAIATAVQEAGFRLAE